MALLVPFTKRLYLSSPLNTATLKCSPSDAICAMSTKSKLNDEIDLDRAVAP